MKASIDTAGRLVIPKKLLRQAGLRPGTEQGLIEIEPVPLLVKLKKRGRFLVAMPDQPIEQLTSGTIERTRRQLTRDRAASSYPAWVVFFSTSASWSPRYAPWHEHHERAITEMERRLAERESLVIATPALIEAYAVLTRLPPPHRVSPRDAIALIETSFLTGEILAGLDSKVFRPLLREAADQDLAGGRIYD